MDPAASGKRHRGRGPRRAGTARGREQYVRHSRRLGLALARRVHLGLPQDMSASPAPPLLLASTSPRRREILELLRIPFDVVAPDYEETEDDPVAHAVGKARSVLAAADGRPVLGCDTEVVCDGRVYGKPASAEEGEQMLETLSGRTHEV